MTGSWPAHAALIDDPHEVTNVYMRLIDDPHEVTNVYMRLIDELGIKQARRRLDFDSTSIGYRLDRSCKRPFSGQAFPSYESMIKNRRSV